MNVFIIISAVAVYSIGVDIQHSSYQPFLYNHPYLFPAYFGSPALADIEDCHKRFEMCSLSLT